MGVLSRLRRVMQAWAHETVGRVEKPATMLNYLVVEMQENLDRAREEVATAMAAERHLAQQAVEAERVSLQWDVRARRAIEHGEDDLAREALRRKLAAQERAESFRRAQQEQLQAITQLRGTLTLMEKRLQEARTRRTELLAKLDAAKAQQVVVHTIRHGAQSDAFETFERIAEQIDTNRHRSAALVDLSRDDIGDAFRRSEETHAIEVELISMKRELGYEGEGEPPALEHQLKPADGE